MKYFLDANAHVAINEKALKAYVDCNKSLAGHGHAQSPSPLGRSAASAIEEARGKIARIIGAKEANQIVFTSTCSQACEWSLQLMSELPLDKVYMSTVEHPAIKFKYRELFKPNSLPISANGQVSGLFQFPPNSGVVCIHVQNEVGIIQPIEQLKAQYLLSDMSQGLGKIKINVSSIPNLYFAAFGAHKFGGPGGVGFMYLKDTTMWKEFGSGSRYYFDRTGTPDTAGIVATGVALEEAENSREQRYANMLEFRDTLESGLEEMGWPVICKDANRIPNTTFMKVPRSMALHLLNQLGSEGIYVGLGSACGAVYSGPSAIMTALNLRGTMHDYIRISQFGEYSVKDAKYILSKLKKYCPRIDVE